MKKKLVAILAIICILVSISATVFAGNPGGISIPPEPIRDSVGINGNTGGGISIPPEPIRDSIVVTE